MNATAVKHTAAPWQSDEYIFSETARFWQILGDAGCQVCDLGDTDLPAAAEANARLIACAPELLDNLTRTNNLLRAIMASLTGREMLAEVQTLYADNRKVIEKANLA